MLQQRARVLYNILVHKYGFDALWINGFGGLGRGLGRLFWRAGDVGLIDGLLVNGSARTVGRVAAAVRGLQSGYLYHYAFAMLIGAAGLITWFMFGFGGQ